MLIAFASKAGYLHLVKIDTPFGKTIITNRLLHQDHLAIELLLAQMFLIKINIIGTDEEMEPLKRTKFTII